MAENRPRGELAVLDPSKRHEFKTPQKCINDGQDVPFFLSSWAYTDIMTFLLQLNAAMFPLKHQYDTTSVQAWTLDMPLEYSKTITKLRTLLTILETMIEEAPPDPGPRRFGNVSFRKWYSLVEGRIDALLDEGLPEAVRKFGSAAEEGATAKDELKAYLMGSFGSAQRLDYGTGHELSFLAFLGCIWKLGGFASDTNLETWGSQERRIVLGVIEPYLHLIRKLILTYTLEPAGTHGVWGLDDHSFLPYVFGSAQLSLPISSPSEVPQEGSLPDAPRPSDVAKSNVVERLRKENMYFSAIGFIHDVKKGPFWEHSPMLFDISGVTAGWAKINKGMVKMYNAEVLSKFPVVQHFPFGSLLRWEINPDAPPISVSSHMSSQPRAAPRVANMPPSSMPVSARQTPGVGATTPWASGPTHRSNAMPGPKTSWTGQAGATGMPATRAPWAEAGISRPAPPSSSARMGAPWKKSTAAKTDAVDLRKADQQD